MKKYAILGYNSLNIGDDIQSFVVSTLLPISYIVLRDDYDKVYDFKTGKQVVLKEKIHLIMNGWFMHSYDGKYKIHYNIKFPIKNNLIVPIFISTCLSKNIKKLFDNESLQYYKKFQPVYCRDTTTMKNLKKNNIDCNFFGCITEILDIKSVKDNDFYKKKYKDSIIYIDCPELFKKRNKNQKAFYFDHYINDIKNMNVKKRIEFAEDRLSRYKYAKKIISYRMHAFLPCRAMGLNVKYVGMRNIYRTKDLVNKKPNRKYLHDTFYKIIDNVI
jgi:hypothetical protein